MQLESEPSIGASSRSLTLRSVDVRVVLIPLNRPIIAKVGSFAEWPVILIDLYTEEGIVGRSYLEPYLVDAVKYIVPAIRDLAEKEKGQLLRPLVSFQNMRKTLHLIGYEGVAMIAISGLDMAAWDALAKASNMPLAVFLGGAVGSVPAYNTNGLWLGESRALGEEAAALVDEGRFSALKVRLGRPRLEDDLKVLESIRAAVGPVELMVDFNQGLSFGDALNRCHALDQLGLYWFEEPVICNDLPGHARLAQELKTPVQLGENFYGPREVARAIDLHASDYVMFDLMRIGGVSGWLRSAPIAGAAGIEVSTHLYPEFGAHLMQITETAHWLEWRDWVNPVLAEPFAVTDGNVIVPDRPGSGLSWNEEAVQAFLRDV